METKKLTNRNTEVLIKWIMFTAAITGMAIISALYPLQGNIPLIVIPSVLVLIFSKPVFFERLKLTTLLTMRILIVLAALRLFPCAIEILSFQNFYKVLKTCSAGRKDFFDTLS